VTQPSVGEQLATINVKLDLLIQQRTDHEARLRILEQSRWKTIGMATAVSGSVAVLAPYLLGR
jgi:hypothetical protein